MKLQSIKFEYGEKLLKLVDDKLYVFVRDKDGTPLTYIIPTVDKFKVCQYKVDEPFSSYLRFPNLSYEACYLIMHVIYSCLSEGRSFTCENISDWAYEALDTGKPTGSLVFKQKFADYLQNNITPVWQ